MDVNLNPAMEAKDVSVSGRVQTAFTVLVYSFAFTSKILVLPIVFKVRTRSECDERMYCKSFMEG